MPPKRGAAARRPDTATRQQAFQIWENSEEYKLWKELVHKKGPFGLITVTTADLTEEWEPFLADLHRLVEIMRVPHKSKFYDMQVLRSSFFNQFEGVDFTKHCDGLSLEFPKAWVDPARYCREAFIEVWNSLGDIEKVDDTTYSQDVSKFKKKLGEFDKTYMKHNSLHKNTYGFMTQILKPLTDVMESNQNLYALEVRAHPKKRWFKAVAPDFRLEACTDTLVKDMTALIERLKKTDTEGIMSVPDIKACLEKQKIDCTDSNSLKFFINNLKNSWKGLRFALRQKTKATINRCKMPLKENEEICEAIRDVIKHDTIAEILVGSNLAKDQLEFMYDVMEHVYNSPMKGWLMTKNEQEEEKHKECVVNTIPTLVVYKAAQQMAHVQRQIQEQDQEAEDLKNEFGIGEEEEIKEEPSEGNSPQPGRSFTKSSLQDRSETVQSVTFEQSREGMKRMWVWEGYILEEKREAWEELAHMISEVNVTVQEDIMDYIITQKYTNGKMTERNVDTYRQELHDGKISARKPQLEEYRPPYRWNHLVNENQYVEFDEKYEEKATKKLKKSGVENPEEILTPQIKFRQDVNPTRCYIDKRIERIISVCEDLGISLRVHNDSTWNLLISEVIKVFEAIEQEQLPESDEDVISTDEEMQGEEFKEDMLEES